jgi:CheY-like chemotaxis protein
VEKPLVLLAEDNEGTCTLIRALLHGAYEIDVAGDGLEAIEKLKSRKYAAILLDLLMPVADGYVVLDHLTNERPELLARVIVLTAALSPRQVQRIRSYPVGAVISKPFEIDALLTAVRDCAKTGSSGSGPFVAAPMLLLLASEVLRRI